MQSFRLFLPIVPLMSAMLLIVLSSSSKSNGMMSMAFITVAALLLTSAQLPVGGLNPHNEDRASYVGTIVGKYIANAWPSRSLVALSTAGSTPYYAHSNHYIDMLGLNDRTIAKRNITTIELSWQNIPGHFKGDGGYIISRRPDFIIIGPAEGTVASRPWFLSDLELSRNPQFHSDYVLFRTYLDSDGHEALNADLTFTYYRRIDSNGDHDHVPPQVP